ncbi:MAG: hypothetical protein P8165_17255, partial [Deltaproteobacteria bacterium]
KGITSCAAEVPAMTADGLYERLLRPIENQMIRTVARIVRDPEDTEDVFQEILAVIRHKLDRAAAVRGAISMLPANQGQV